MSKDAPPLLATRDVEIRPHHPLPRLTRKVFADLAIWMMGLGLIMGTAFPFFVVALGVPSRYVLSVPFFLATLGAGLVVGASNYFLSRLVVRSRLRFMGSRMAHVEENLRRGTYGETDEECTPERCFIPVDSDDELGDAASSFNHLVAALARSQTATGVARRFASVLSSHLELEPLVDAALRNLLEAGGFDAAALCVMRDGELTVVDSTGFIEPGGLVTSSMVERSFRTLDTVKLRIPDDIRLDAGPVSFRPRTIVAYPIHTRLVPIGVLVCASTGTISDDDDDLIGHLLPNFAVALNNSLSHERLQQVAAIDPLTGLHNRRFGLERLRQEFSRSVRSMEPLGVLLFDIDHFKTVNDSYGHEAGDHVLRAIADGVTGALREGDTVMRYGGEEFLAVLPGAGESDVRVLGERIRRVVEATVTVNAQVSIRVTASVGAASFPSADVADIEDLIRRADAAMYEAKNAGRNQLIYALA